MKNLILKFVLSVSLCVNIVYANPVNDFADSIASTIFKIAWPSARYKKVEVVEHNKISSGYNIILKFNGNSNGMLCMVGDCPLWFTLNLQTDSNFSIKNMKVLEYNAIIAKPFQTAGAITQAMQEANNKNY